jgi:hypothetical protein
LQITENKTAGAKAQHDFVALPARLKSCPDTFCSLNGILQEALVPGINPWPTARTSFSAASQAHLIRSRLRCEFCRGKTLTGQLRPFKALTCLEIS